MKLHLNELLAHQEQEYQWEVSVGWLQSAFQEDSQQDSSEDSLFRATSPLQLWVWAYRNEGDVFFRANVKGEFDFTCVRSLKEGRWPVQFEFSGIYRTPEADEYEEPDDPSHFFYKNEEIDFGDALREHLFLNLPLNPTLDGEEGLTYKEEPEPALQDAKETVDPRWAVLQQLRDAQKKEVS